MEEIWEKLQAIKTELDAIEMQIAMNVEATESIEMSLRFMLAELDYLD